MQLQIMWNVEYAECGCGIYKYNVEYRDGIIVNSQGEKIRIACTHCKMHVIPAQENQALYHIILYN